MTAATPTGADEREPMGDAAATNLGATSSQLGPATGADEAAERDEPLTRHIELADEILRAPSRFTTDFVIRAFADAAADMRAVLDERGQLRQRVAELEARPRPFPTKAVAEITPELEAKLRAAFAAAARCPICGWTP